MTSRHRYLTMTVSTLTALGLSITGTAGATLQIETAKAWDRYVAATEARIEREAGSSVLSADFARVADAHRLLAEGRIPVAKVNADSQRAVSIPGGTIQHWRGAVLLPGARLEPLLDVVQHPPENGPFAEGVIALRVLRRQPDALDLFIRMTSSRIITVTYDTEHHVEYRRYGAGRASSRSVASRIVEVEDSGTPRERQVPPGDDHGFLWRMNSYWRYEQTPQGVLVEMESLTLSRAVPAMVRFVVDPAVDRVARDSLERTLSSFRDVNLALLRKSAAVSRSPQRALSNSTTSTSVSATAATRRDPSGDQLTHRAMRIGRSPKSVTWRG